MHSDGTYKDERDPNGGVTSKLGFRIVIESDGQVRVINTTTGQAYIRPLEAQAVAERARQLEAEVARLRALVQKQKGSETGG